MLLNKFRKYSLALAESFDSWRVIPRAILVVYSALVMNLYLWFKSIPTFVQERCDAGVLRMLLEQHISLDEAKMIACSVVDVVGGPTSAQSAFVTTITGLSAGIFGLYTATGRKWDGGLPDDINRKFNYDAPAPTKPQPKDKPQKKSKLDDPDTSTAASTTTTTTTTIGTSTASVDDNSDDESPRLSEGEGDGMDDEGGVDTGPTL